MIFISSIYLFISVNIWVYISFLFDVNVVRVSNMCSVAPFRLTEIFNYLRVYPKEWKQFYSPSLIQFIYQSMTRGWSFTRKLKLYPCPDSPKSLSATWQFSRNLTHPIEWIWLRRSMSPRARTISASLAIICNLICQNRLWGDFTFIRPPIFRLKSNW